LNSILGLRRNAIFPPDLRGPGNGRREQDHAIAPNPG
jgi:hypothetical protein